MNVTLRLMELLKRGPMNYVDAARELGTTVTSLRVLVHRQVKLGKLRVTKPAALIELLLLACLLLTACGQPACDPHPGYRPDGQQCN